jgi:hypothetical protein
MTETRNLDKYPEHVQHDDLRVQALLILAQFAVDCVPTPTPLVDASVAIVPHVDRELATRQFKTIVADFESAVDYDTRGAEAVRENLGRWDDTVGVTADEKATEMRDELRLMGRYGASMLVTLEDKLAGS